MLMPRKVAHRKHHRGRTAGPDQGRRTAWRFGEYGIQALEPGWLTARQIEAARIAMTRAIKRGGKVWINVFPDKPVTKKPAETRMGSGKGNPEFWVAVVRPGRVLFELSYPERGDRQGGARAKAIQKLPIKARVITREEVYLNGQARPPTSNELDLAELVDELRATKQEALNLRFRNATGQLDNTAEISRVRRQIARINTFIRQREIAAAEAGAEKRMSEADGRPKPTPPRQATPATPARSARASSCRTRWTRPPSSPSSSACATPSTPSSCMRTKKLYVHDEANDANVGDKVRVMETRPLSKTKRWRVVEVLERAKSMIQQESRLRVADNSGAKEVLVHQGARRHPPPLRLDRRHLRRHRQGRHPRRRREEGRRRQVRRRPHQEGEAPSRRQLHPLRRERGRADQGRPHAARHAHLRPGRPRAARHASSCASSRSPRRCCDHEAQEG